MWKSFPMTWRCFDRLRLRCNRRNQTCARDIEIVERQAEYPAIAGRAQSSGAATGLGWFGVATLEPVLLALGIQFEHDIICKQKGVVSAMAGC